MARISIKEKKLYRSMRDHGVSKNKANRILKDVAGKRTSPVEASRSGRGPSQEASERPPREGELTTRRLRLWTGRLTKSDLRASFPSLHHAEVDVLVPLGGCARGYVLIADLPVTVEDLTTRAPQVVRVADEDRIM